MPSWSELSKQVLLPIGFMAISGVASWTASEVASMRKDLVDLRVDIAKLQTELSMHREEERKQR